MHKMSAYVLVLSLYSRIRPKRGHAHNGPTTKSSQGGQWHKAAERLRKVLPLPREVSWSGEEGAVVAGPRPPRAGPNWEMGVFADVTLRPGHPDPGLSSWTGLRESWWGYGHMSELDAAELST